MANSEIKAAVRQHEEEVTSKQYAIGIQNLYMALLQKQGTPTVFSFGPGCEFLYKADTFIPQQSLKTFMAISCSSQRLSSINAFLALVLWQSKVKAQTCSSQLKDFWSYLQAVRHNKKNSCSNNNFNNNNSRDIKNKIFTLFFLTAFLVLQLKHRTNLVAGVWDSIKKLAQLRNLRSYLESN